MAAASALRACASASGEFDLMRPLATPSGLAARRPLCGNVPDGALRQLHPRQSLHLRRATLRSRRQHGWRPAQLPRLRLALAWRVGVRRRESAELVLAMDESRVDDVYRYDASAAFRPRSSGIDGRDRAGQSRRPPHAVHLRSASVVSASWRRAHPFRRDVPVALRRGRAGGAARSRSRPEADYATPRPPPSGYRNVCYAGWDGRAEIAWPDDGVAISMICGSGLPPSDAARSGGRRASLLPRTADRARPARSTGSNPGPRRRRPYPRARRPGFGDLPFRDPQLIGPPAEGSAGAPAQERHSP